MKEREAKKHRVDQNFTLLDTRTEKTKNELRLIANELLSRNKESNAAKFILLTVDKVTLFAELATKWIRIPDNNNHVENLMGIVGLRVKKNRQSWIDKNLIIMLDTIWHIIS